MVGLLVDLKESGELHIVKGDMRTIRELKLRIEERHNIPFHQQILVHKNKSMLHNGRELAGLVDTHRRIKVYTKLSPQMIKVQILIRKSDDIFVEIASNDSVLRLMMLIDERIGLSPHRQRLYSERSDLMYEHDVLDEYITGKGPYYFCLESVPMDDDQLLHILLEKNGKLSNVNVENSDSIYTLHGVARKRGLASGYGFYFVWRGIRLFGPNTFAWYGIPEGSTVHLVEGDDDDIEDDDHDEQDDGKEIMEVAE